MSTIGLYLRMNQPAANALRARLNDAAGSLGYTAIAGPTAGGGNLPELLRAIDAGEVALVLLPEQNRASATEFLREQSDQLRVDASDFHTIGLADALADIANALDAAAERATNPERR